MIKRYSTVTSLTHIHLQLVPIYGLFCALLNPLGAECQLIHHSAHLITVRKRVESIVIALE